MWKNYTNLKKIRKDSSQTLFLYWSAVILFLIATIIYHYQIVIPILDKYTIDDTYGYIANIHDHLEYQSWILGATLIEGDARTYFGNVAGISTFYLMLTLGSGFYDVVELSLIVNSIAFMIAAYNHLKISQILSNKKNLAFTFFINLPLIYFCQLVGKDMLYIALLYSILLQYLRGRWILMTVIMLLGMIIRTQLLILLFFIIILSIERFTIKKRLFLVYIVSSILGSLAFTSEGVLGKGADLGEGISGLAYYLNDLAYIGNLLLNPIRVIQYIMEFFYFGFLSFSFDFLPFSFMILPLVLYFIINFSKLKRFSFVMFNPAMKFSVALFSLLLVVPIINLRYFVAIIPFIILAINSRSYPPILFKQNR